MEGIGDGAEVPPELKKMLLGKLLGCDDGNDDSRIESDGNHIKFYSDVDRKSCFKLIQKIEEVTKEIKFVALEYNIEKVPDIYLHINSNGGTVDDAFAVVDYIEKNEIPITTICEGFVASAGTLISCAGHKRQMLKNTNLLIHQLSSGFWGKMMEIQDSVENMSETMNRIISFYAKKTRMGKKQLKKLLKHDLEWNAQVCLEKGLVDEII